MARDRDGSPDRKNDAASLKRTRRLQGLTQGAFAQRYGLQERWVQDVEQRRVGLTATGRFVDRMIAMFPENAEAVAQSLAEEDATRAEREGW